jgi:DNA-binding IclR family transcriptional regulator
MREAVNRYVIESALKTFAVLEALDAAVGSGAVCAADLARATKLSVNFTFRALKTLEAAGYAKQIADGRWRLTGRLARFSDRIFDAAERSPVRPIIITAEE